MSKKKKTKISYYPNLNFYPIGRYPLGNKRKNFRERQEMQNSLESPMAPPMGKIFYMDTI